jgi:hypothetical protein
VRDTDHDIALLLFAEQVDVLLSNLSRIQEGNTLTVAVEDKTLQRGIERKDTYLYITPTNGNIRLNETFEHRTREVVVRTNNGKFGHLEDTSHIIHTEIEFMIADGGTLITHLIHQTYLDLTLEERIVARALTEVATIEEQEIWMLLTLFLDQIDTTQETATSSEILIIEIGV